MRYPPRVKHIPGVAGRYQDRAVNDNKLHERFERLDARLTGLMARHGIAALRISLGLVFVWFGFLKFFPGSARRRISAARTIGALSFGLIPPAAAVLILAAWELLIGIGLLTGARCA